MQQKNHDDASKNKSNSKNPSQDTQARSSQHAQNATDQKGNQKNDDNRKKGMDNDEQMQEHSHGHQSGKK